jgi:hypothetical protein
MSPRAQAYAIACRMEELLEALDEDGTYWPHYDDEVRARVYKEMGIPGTDGAEHGAQVRQ